MMTRDYESGINRVVALKVLNKKINEGENERCRRRMKKKKEMNMEVMWAK